MQRKKSSLDHSYFDDVLFGMVVFIHNDIIIISFTMFCQKIPDPETAVDILYHENTSCILTLRVSLLGLVTEVREISGLRFDL
jgi:hypothetical protein